MTPRTIVVMIAALAVAGVVVKIGLLGEAPALSSAVVKREGLPSDATQMPPMESATELLDDYDLVHAVEHAGVGNLVIALHDGAMLPLVDEEVEIRGAWREAGEARAHTDHRGEVAFEGIVEGGYLYTVQVAGGPLLIASAPVYVQPDETTLLRLQVRDYDHVIGGRVLDRQGAPVAGLKITAKALRLASVTDGPKLRRDSTASTHADDDGLFEIAGLRAGDYEISIEADEHYGAASVTVRAGVDSAVLTVAARRMRRIEGKVTSITGDGLSGVKVMPPPGSSDTVLTDSKGDYSLVFDEGSGVGRRYLRFLLDDYQESRVPLESLYDHDKTITGVDITLTALGTTVTVSGRITDDHGQAVAGEHVQFHSPSRYTTYRTASGPNGEFRVDGVAVSDDYRVWVRPKGAYGDHDQTAVALTYDQPYFDIVLPSLATGTLRGHVLDSRRDPMPDFHFWLRSEEAEGKALEVSTDVDGWFVLEQVPAGRLTLGTRSLPQVRLAGIELTAGTDKYVEVILD